MVQLLRGTGDVARGGGFLLSHPRLLVWVVAPAVITLLVIAAVIGGVVVLADPAPAWVAAHLPSWLSWVAGLLRVVVVGGLAVLGYLVFVTVAGLLAGPFCEMLSEAVEEEVTGAKASGFSLAAFARGLAMGIIHAARRLLVYVATVILVFVLGAAIPGIGQAIAFALGAYFASTSAAYDCFDAVLARRLWAYRRKLDFLRAHRGRTLGVGAATAGLMLVPVVNLFALGMGAAGATLAVIDLERGGPPAAPPR